MNTVSHGDQTATALSRLDPAWAWAAYRPSTGRPWNVTLAAHLFRRAGFGAAWDELQRAVALGPEATVNELLNPANQSAGFNETFDQHEAAAARSGDPQAFVAWWLRRMVQTPFPLPEKLTLFWQQHFAIGSAAVGDLTLYHRHLQRLRAGALGDLGALLRALLDDPAMYVALGGDQNRQARPNRQFARNWLEVFTVGPGTSSAADVRDAARALAGWFVYGGRLRFLERERDPGDKTILGQSGSFGRDELRDILASHPATARHLAGKLYRWLMAEGAAPPDALLQPLADRLQRQEKLQTVVAMMLRSNLFFSEHAVRQKIKSPVELAVGLARNLEILPPTLPMARDLAQLGQPLNAPPTMRGWPQGADWINTVTMGARLRCCQALIEGTAGYGQAVDARQIARGHGRTTPAEMAQFWQDLLVQVPVASSAVRTLRRLADEAEGSEASGRRQVLAVIAQPEFQLN